MGKRVSYEQRQMLFTYMQGHEDFARGRVTGPDAARRKQKKLEELAEILNSAASGATKTPEKWFKCWQDWKSDTKNKYLKIKKARAGTGGGPSPAPLTPLEENLIQFFGFEMVEGLPGVADPLQVSEAASAPTTFPIDVSMDEVLIEEEVETPSSNVGISQESQRKSKNDPLHSILERQAAAIENVAAGMHEIASALRQIAAALQPLQP